MEDFRQEAELVRSDGPEHTYLLPEVGPYDLVLKMGGASCSEVLAAGAIEDTTSWELLLICKCGDHLVGPEHAPGVFEEMPWTRYWRCYSAEDGREFHVGAYVPTETVQALVDFLRSAHAEQNAPHSVSDPQDARLAEMIARQEEEQRQAEVESEVDEFYRRHPDWF